MEAIEVRRSHRARHWRLVVPWGEPARLTVPDGMTTLQIERVLRRQQEWIARQRQGQVPRLGLERLVVSESESRTKARELVSEVAKREASALGVTYERIRIGAPRTRWGSCSPNGTLSFNWKLVLAPLDVLDYVVVHELCHLRVRDHSRRFWRVVEERRPQWRQQQDWLRVHGAELLAFRASA
jgi:predicted metal-dependent hydrolase